MFPLFLLCIHRLHLLLPVSFSVLWFVNGQRLPLVPLFSFSFSLLCNLSLNFNVKRLMLLFLLSQGILLSSLTDHVLCADLLLPPFVVIVIDVLPDPALFSLTTACFRLKREEGQSLVFSVFVSLVQKLSSSSSCLFEMSLLLFLPPNLGGDDIIRGRNIVKERLEKRIENQSTSFPWFFSSLSMQFHVVLVTVSCCLWAERTLAKNLSNPGHTFSCAVSCVVIVIDEEDEHYFDISPTTSSLSGVRT